MSLDIFKQLVQRHGHIRVPMIQRDYAQGRPAESEVREEFLNTLEEALRKPATDPTLPLNLDFIYGSVEGDQETRFLPLDGQQRLTTLFLLHWYLAWRDNQWPVFEELFLAGKHARFAYSVRPSSNEFFDQLVIYHPSVGPEDVADLTQLITDQPWYFRSWRLDPTIQSVLSMLNAIHRRFASSSGLFARLIDESRPAITFQLLDLENFGLSDDLYIKMNARGKPLTAFETFKARYEQELKSQLAGKTFDLAGQPLGAADYVARRMDTVWTDLFWKLRNPKSHLYDEAIMNVFRAVALVTRKPDDEGYVEDVARLRNGRNAPSHTDFHARSWLDEPFTLAVIHLLDAWSVKTGTFSGLLPDTCYFDEKSFFDRIALNGANLSYTEIVQFAAYVRFIAKFHDSIDAAAFREWMRIIHNLSVNTTYNRVEDFQRSTRGLGELLENAWDILNHLAQTEGDVSGFNEQQIAEEKLKAELILAQDTWRELVDRAESHGYFRGQIEFLLDFSGTVAKRAESEPTCWDAAAHKTLQDRFSRYLALAERMFSTNGLVDLGEYRWQRALLSIGDYLLPKGRNHSFLVNPVTDEASWKRLLRGSGGRSPGPRGFLKQLWDRLTPDQDIAQQLDSIIDASQQLEPWREAIVLCPEALDYCGSRFNVRWYNPYTLYLLQRSQLNGTHAELFTFCLHQTLKSQSDFTVLSSSYQSVMDTYSEPHVRLRGRCQGKDVTFSVYNQNEDYQIRISKSDCVEIANLGETLKRAGYAETDDFYQHQSSRSTIKADLKALDKALHSTFYNEIDHI